MTVYLDRFHFPDNVSEEIFLSNEERLKATCYSSVYPFTLFFEKGLEELKFEPVTFLYGGNGSGKTTILNIIAEKMKIQRGTYFNKSDFFDDYVGLCEQHTINSSFSIWRNSRIITSDDVFDYMLAVRCVNEKIDIKRENLFDEYMETKYSSFQMRSLDDYEQLKKNNDVKKHTFSKYVKRNLMGNIREQSNGESAFWFFTENIKENALYLLDEPENSLAVELQVKLLKFIEDSARFFGCQFIIATHSPFLLSMKESQIYDLDETPIAGKKWTELENVRSYFNFFKEHEEEFK
ncbi:AAA family ATPase [Aminipila luticellarii]|uniref:ATP-binding cassette domain-containing protein n=1 Tax=Aminipila luticellarii TaxID=2507160 RepID=A0A410PY72_9FIRM|nr:AAA family ATPase [Aminipila luticellarii]QAT43917.1 ATP-binding cassette domain-containing protein [Aminipila luticellarii]